MKRQSILDALFDRPPERLPNGYCADCQFLGKNVNGEWVTTLYKACDWHRRHSGPFGPEEKPLT